MKFNARWAVYPLLLLAGAGALYVRFQHENTVGPGMESAEPGDPLPDIAAGADAPNAMEQSHWLSDRAHRYRALLKGWKCDVVVAPVQVEELGFDRPTRVLMSADIAAALDSPCVADPLLIGSALGEGLRRHALADVQSMAADIGAKTLLVTYAGHNRSGAMRVTWQVYGRGEEQAAFKLLSKKSFDDMSYTDHVSPIDSFHEHLPKMMSAVGLPSRKKEPIAAGTLPADLPSPASIRGDASTPATAAAEYLLLGGLAPHPYSQASDRLYAKGFVALIDATDDPLVRRLRARALLHLGERPYALDVIANDRGPEFDGLRAVLNGDLPSAKAALDADKDTWDRAFLALEVFDLQLKYRSKGDAQAAAVLGAFGPDWSTLITARLSDSDFWRVPASVDLKRSLDTLFPIKGESLDDIATGSQITGRYEEQMAFDQFAVKHIRSSMQKDAAKWCCATFALKPAAPDLLDVYSSRAEWELLQYASYYKSPQGKYELALGLLEKYHDILDGFGDAEKLRALTEWTIKDRGNRDSPAEREERIRKAARIAVVADPGQNDASSSSLWYLLQTPAEPFARRLGDAYCEDYPVRSGWYGAPDTLRVRLLFSTDDVIPIQELIKHSKGGERDALVGELDHRFVGNEMATNLRLDYGISRRASNPADLREEIAADPENWNLYERLAKIHISRGEYADASKIALSFPEFASASGNTVDRGIDAFDIGRMLFSQGAFEQGRPLLKIAADYHNGAFSSTAAHAMLADFDGDYTTAAQDYIAAAQHYQSTEAFRRFLCLVFASGDSEHAWDYLDQLTRRYKGSDLWMAAMTGHRIENIDTMKLQKWLLDHAKDREPARDDDSIVIYALAEQMTDRDAPPDSFVQTVRTLAGASGVQATRDGKSFSGTLASGRERTVGPSRFGRSRRSPVVAGSEAPSRYALLAEAYSALRQNRSSEAVQAFDKLASYYDIDSTSEWGFVLPYFAFAAADSGDPLALKQFVEPGADRNDAWGVHLALAVFDAMQGQHEAASSMLDKAFRERPNRGRWPVDTSYQFAEVCTWLFDRTHEARYRARALDWARAVTRLEPTSAWAYALIARFSADKSEQLTALSKALYLDPQSHWASMTPKDMQNAAKAVLAKKPAYFALKPTNARTQL